MKQARKFPDIKVEKVAEWLRFPLSADNPQLKPMQEATRTLLAWGEKNPGRCATHGMFDKEHPLSVTLLRTDEGFSQIVFNIDLHYVDDASLQTCIVYDPSLDEVAIEARMPKAVCMTWQNMFGVKEQKVFKGDDVGAVVNVYDHTQGLHILNQVDAITRSKCIKKFMQKNRLR